MAAAKKEIRLLNADEIECRVGTVNEKGISLLLYKDARVDQRILDESFGPFGWRRSHQSIDGNLYCTVEVYDDEKHEWVGKQDVGTTGFAEKEKSQASDSFKRACFNWGIGRELYTAGFIWVPAGKVNISMKDNKWCCFNRFTVKTVTYDKQREISGLVIVNENGETVYQFGKGKQTAEEKPTDTPPSKNVTKLQMKSLEKELQRTGVSMDAVKARYGVNEAEGISAETYGRIMQALQKTKSAEAA